MSIFFDRARIDFTCRSSEIDCPYSINVWCWCLSSHISLASHGLMDEFLICFNLNGYTL